MDDVETRALGRQNDNLKLGRAQLQDDVTKLGGQVTRPQQELARLHGQRSPRAGSLEGSRA